MNNTHSIQDAVAYITTALEAGPGVDNAAAEFDLEAIASDLYDVAGSYDVDTVDAETFWSIIERHVRAA